MTGPLDNQSLAHHRTRTFHVHSHTIMTLPLAHFDLHITMAITRTSPYSHIPCSLAHYDRTTRTLTKLALANFDVVKTGPIAH